MKSIRSVQKSAIVLAIGLVTASLSWGQGLQPTFQSGDVFVAIGAVGEGDTGKVEWYRKDGTFVATLDTGQTNTETAGVGFDQSGNLYAAVFQANNVVKFDHSGTLVGTFGSGYSSVDPPVSNHPESIFFDSAGNAYVGQADGSRQVLKFDSSGTPLATFSPATQDRGTDWIDLAGDQKTLFYTSEGTSVKRFDLSTSTQLPDFNVAPLPGAVAYALRIMPDGQVLVADTDRVVRLDNTGIVAQTYSPEPNNQNPVIFGLTLDPDGKSFWTADLFSGDVWKIDIATGTIDLTFNAGSNDVGGLAVFQEITSSNSKNLAFPPSPTPQTQIATIGQPTDPAAHSLALTLASVITPINVLVTFFYEPTDLSTGNTGVGIADGICEVSQGATEANDFDCRLAQGGFVYQTLTNMDQVVPHIIPSHNNLGVWVRVTATRVSDGQPAVAGVDYTGPVDWYYAWNTNPVLFPSPNTEYSFGWNNLNPQMFDRHGEDPDIAFKFNITTYSKFNCNPTCVGTADPGTGGRTITLNDIVVADPPNPPTGSADVAKFVVPVPGISPFVYEKGDPMFVAFRLRNATTGVSDPNATTFPHSVNVAVLDPVTGLRQPVQTFPGFPTTFTYNKFRKLYFIVLTPKFYTLGKQYQLQVNCDLFPQALNARFVVVRDDD